MTLKYFKRQKFCRNWKYQEQFTNCENITFHFSISTFTNRLMNLLPPPWERMHICVYKHSSPCLISYSLGTRTPKKCPLRIKRMWILPEVERTSKPSLTTSRKTRWLWHRWIVNHWPVRYSTMRSSWMPAQRIWIIIWSSYRKSTIPLMSRTILLG